MRPLFQRRTTTATVAPVHDDLAASREGAYREGRIDERRAEARAPATAPAAEAAYRRGRADARPRRRGGSPILTLIVFLVVAFGALMLYLAARNGSFAQGGAVIDHSLSSATQPVRRAEDDTGAALERAGQHLKQDAGSPSQ